MIFGSTNVFVKKKNKQEGAVVFEKSQQEEICLLSTTNRVAFSSKILKSFSKLVPSILIYFTKRNQLKNIKNIKNALFYQKCSFHSWDIQTFVLSSSPFFRLLGITEFTEKLTEGSSQTLWYHLMSKHE